MSDLSSAIDKLRALSPQLNAAVIEADRVVGLVENFLVNECGLGVEAEVPLHYNDKGKVITLLRYASVNGSFRITVTHTDGSTHFVARPWSECDRNQRLVSFTALPKLLIAVAKSVEQQIASTTSTAATVGQIINALGDSARESTPALPDPFANDGGLTLLIGDNDDDQSPPPMRSDSSASAIRARMNGIHFTQAGANDASR
ncbi:MAG TPA: hypothetical protein VG326_15350 [Tepidisphaeraceae bacterium]|jgi:hypothetical protein|nr:hypothetical protein [Tepidisphaeraceae bacterium]